MSHLASPATEPAMQRSRDPHAGTTPGLDKEEHQRLRLGMVAVVLLLRAL